MPRRRPGFIPALVHHTPSGRGRVRIDGRDIWLGKWGAPQTESAYQRVITEFLATGRVESVPRRRAVAPTGFPSSAPTVPVAGQSVQGCPTGALPDAVAGDEAPPPAELTVCEVALRYREHCRDYYRDRAGKQTSSYSGVMQAIKALRPYDEVPAKNFGPKTLTLIRDAEIVRGRSRVGCNKLVAAICRVFRWAESQELIPGGATYSLQTVKPLQMGRSGARELEKIGPVPDAVVEATLPYLPPIVADMVRFQGYTGARPGEVCSIRPMDVNRSADLWHWRPPHHKTAWRGRERLIIIGKRGEQILLKYLLREDAAFCFSPVESERQRSRDRRQQRRSPLTPSQRARKPKRKGLRRPKDCYDNDSYRRAITRAVEVLNADRLREDPESKPIASWAPNQLRHSFASKVRERFGVEEVQVVLGHEHADVSQVYAKRDEKLALKVMHEMG